MDNRRSVVVTHLLPPRVAHYHLPDELLGACYYETVGADKCGQREENFHSNRDVFHYSAVPINPDPPFVRNFGFPFRYWKLLA